MKNKIICGDCGKVMSDFPSESVDLIYLDPPFSSNRNYVGFWQKTGEKLVFDDHWEAGIKGYIDWLTPRIKECRRVLKPTGSLYFHCDWHANAYIRIMLDKIFGMRNFRNEIIWHYTKMNASSKNWIQNHDTIFFYTKSNDWTFNTQYLEEESALKTRLKHITDKDDKIRWRMAKIIKQQLLDSYISSAKKRIGRPLINSDIIIDFKDKGKKKIDNVWYIPIIKGNAKESLGYPTQKPEALLERIIKASSNEGDLVLDPFCGCGTTCVAAKKLNRNYIGIDVSNKAIDISKKRMIL